MDVYNNGLVYGGKLKISNDRELRVSHNGSFLIKMNRKNSKIVDRKSLDDVTLPIGAIVRIVTNIVVIG